MIESITSTARFSITIEAFDVNTDVVFSKVVDELTFMQAGDYAEKSVSHFDTMIHYADKFGWHVVLIEIMNDMGTVEVIRISR